MKLIINRFTGFQSKTYMLSITLVSSTQNGAGLTTHMAYFLSTTNVWSSEIVHRSFGYDTININYYTSIVAYIWIKRARCRGREVL